MLHFSQFLIILILCLHDRKFPNASLCNFALYSGSQDCLVLPPIDVFRQFGCDRCTGGVAHVDEGTDSDGDALVILINVGEGGWLWIVCRELSTVMLSVLLTSCPICKTYTCVYYRHFPI